MSKVKKIFVYITIFLLIATVSTPTGLAAFEAAKGSPNIGADVPNDQDSNHEVQAPSEDITNPSSSDTTSTANNMETATTNNSEMDNALDNPDEDTAENRTQDTTGTARASDPTSCENSTDVTSTVSSKNVGIAKAQSGEVTTYGAIYEDEILPSEDTTETARCNISNKGNAKASSGDAKANCTVYQNDVEMDPNLSEIPEGVEIEKGEDCSGIIIHVAFEYIADVLGLAEAKTGDSTAVGAMAKNSISLEDSFTSEDEGFQGNEESTETASSSGNFSIANEGSSEASTGDAQATSIIARGRLHVGGTANSTTKIPEDTDCNNHSVSALYNAAVTWLWSCTAVSGDACAIGTKTETLISLFSSFFGDSAHTNVNASITNSGRARSRTGDAFAQLIVGNRSPILNPIGDKIVDEGQNLSFTLSANDPDGDELYFLASSLPMGATFDPETRTFSWTPKRNQSGVYQNVHFEASDGISKDSEDITITVNNVPQTQVIWTEVPLAPAQLRVVKTIRTTRPMLRPAVYIEPEAAYPQEIFPEEIERPVRPKPLAKREAKRGMPWWLWLLISLLVLLLSTLLYQLWREYKPKVLPPKG
ncbi:MAG: Ig domain-containing protein [Actinomycetota bacterium]